MDIPSEHTSHHPDNLWMLKLPWRTTPLGNINEADSRLHGRFSYVLPTKDMWGVWNVDHIITFAYFFQYLPMESHSWCQSSSLLPTPPPPTVVSRPWCYFIFLFISAGHVSTDLIRVSTLFSVGFTSFSKSPFFAKGGDFRFLHICLVNMHI